MEETREKMKLRKGNDGLSGEERANRLHDSFRRFILRDEEKDDS